MEKMYQVEWQLWLLKINTSCQGIRWWFYRNFNMMLGSWGDLFELPWPWDMQNHHVKYIESEHDSFIMINKYVNYWDILDLGSGVKWRNLPFYKSILIKKFLKVARLVLLSIHKLSFFFERTVNINIQCRCLDCVWLSDNITYEKSAKYEKSRDIKSRNLEIGYKSGSKIWVNVWTCHVSLHPVGRFCLIWQ